MYNKMYNNDKTSSNKEQEDVCPLSGSLSHCLFIRFYLTPPKLLNRLSWNFWKDLPWHADGFRLKNSRFSQPFAKTTEKFCK